MGDRTAAEYVREARAAVVLLVEAVEALVAADERTERRIAALEQAAVPATPTPVAQPSACGHPLREQGPVALEAALRKTLKEDYGIDTPVAPSACDERCVGTCESHHGQHTKRHDIMDHQWPTPCRAWRCDGTSPAHAKATEPTPPAEPVTGRCPLCNVPYDGCLHRAQAEEAASEPVTGQMWEQRATAAESALAALRAACVLSEEEREALAKWVKADDERYGFMVETLARALARITKEAEVKP